MFDKYTTEYLIEQAKEMGKALGVDTRQGSIYMDACMGHIFRVSKFYEDLRLMFDLLFMDTCSGDILDEAVAQRMLKRKEATPSCYRAVFQGVEAENLLGERFMVDGYYFTLSKINADYVLKSEIKGAETNSILSGKTLIPMRTINGLISATLGSVYSLGSDQESDDDLRKRYRSAISGPAENGNSQQYKTWCEEYEGIGRAIIKPLGMGNNTVKAVLISSAGRSPDSTLVEKIQKEIDPESKGLGLGKAFIGCKFYAVAATEFPVNISFVAVKDTGSSNETIKDLAQKSIAQYLKNIALESPDNDQMQVQYVKVVGILSNIHGLKDFSNMMINGGTANITIDEGKVAVLGEVVIS